MYFKTVNSLNDLNEYFQIDTRTEYVEVIDVKLNNRKTKKIGDNKSGEAITNKNENPVTKNISEKIVENNKPQNKDPNLSLKVKNNSRFKMPDRRKRIYSKSANW